MQRVESLTTGRQDGRVSAEQAARALGCRICGGRLQLRYPGTTEPPTPESLAPSRHQPGEHGDLFACVDCGAVVQPSLLARPRLHELYRSMVDGSYLAEEGGRRATAGRLLDLITPYAPVGRLLEVGCGYGLLLAEAQARGYDVLGLEPAAAAAQHARDALGVRVHEVPLEEFGHAPEERFDVIVLADVIEHLADPVAALDTCRELLAPAGVLCVVTPDPSSVAARVAGSRWWGYLPAHSCLLPRQTLTKLLEERGLDVVEDVALVRSFTLGRWIYGLAERAGPLSAPLERLSRARVGRRLVSLSLGDERVVLAAPRRQPGPA